MRFVINKQDYVKYILVYIGNKQKFLVGLPMKDISLERALKEYNLIQCLESGLYLLREIKNGD